MTKILLLFLAVISLPAHAIYKCEASGKITYRDSPCENAAPIKINPLTNVSSADRDQAQLRSELQKNVLNSLDSARRKNEEKQEKEQKKYLRAQASLQKKCAALALRVKWSEEDAAAAPSKSALKAQRAARRQNEKFEAECKNRGIQ